MIFCNLAENQWILLGLLDSPKIIIIIIIIIPKMVTWPRKMQGEPPSCNTMMLLCSKYISMALSKCNAKAQQDAFNVWGVACYQLRNNKNNLNLEKRLQHPKQTQIPLDTTSAPQNEVSHSQHLNHPEIWCHSPANHQKNWLPTPTPAFSHALVMAPKLMAVGTRFLDKAWKISRDIGQDLTEVEGKGDTYLRWLVLNCVECDISILFDA